MQNEKGDESVSLFSLLDHYDEAQLPDRPSYELAWGSPMWHHCSYNFVHKADDHLASNTCASSRVPQFKITCNKRFQTLKPENNYKNSQTGPSLEMIVIRECLRIRKDILTDFQDLYPKTKLIFKAILFGNDIRRMQNMAFFSDKLKNQEERWEAMKEGHVHHTVKALIDTTSCSNFISKSSCWGVRSLAPYENLIVNAFITLLRC
uniref:Uncharacterized protein n=1 Tax=Rhizophagus irregularis (strain DAOM 181602 / DAOM 197198 / MUCL 43194) TaxID=747089 RepID=U9UD70_RHIID